MKKIFLFMAFKLVFLSVLDAGIALPPGERPVKIFTNFRIIDLDSINTSNQSYDARVFFIVRWKDERLAHKGKAAVMMPLAKIWNPMIQIRNQRKVWKSTPDIAEVEPDGMVTYKQGLWGTFTQPLKLNDFPFDTQKMSLQLVSGSGCSPDELQFVHKENKMSGIAKKLSIADWEVINWEVDTEPYMLTDFAPRPAIDFTFTVRRLTAYYVVKMILPLVMIVIMSWAVFWMDPHNVGSNVGVSITSMLTLIAYRFSADTILPRLSYITCLDYFILASTILVFLSLFQNLTTSALARQNKMGKARKLDVSCRLGFPVIFFLIILETMYFRWFL